MQAITDLTVRSRGGIWILFSKSLEYHGIHNFDIIPQ